MVDERSKPAVESGDADEACKASRTTSHRTGGDALGRRDRGAADDRSDGNRGHEVGGGPLGERAPFAQPQPCVNAVAYISAALPAV